MGRKLNKKKLADEVVDQDTGEVRKGQPGGDGQGLKDRPTMGEKEAREINGYEEHESVADEKKEKLGRKYPEHFEDKDNGNA